MVFTAHHSTRKPFPFLVTLLGILFLLVLNAHAQSSSSNGTKDDDDDDPGETAQDLASDLAPLLALFGERFASQFMSEAMSWVDCVVFSLAPLGIITAIVGAIRVGGPSWLKALIGRARETFAIAEMETMSSTSHEVCECWNGRSIVRVMGKPRMIEILFIEKEYNKEENALVGPDKPLEQDQKYLRRFGLYTIDEARGHDPTASRYTHPPPIASTDMDDQEHVHVLLGNPIRYLRTLMPTSRWWRKTRTEDPENPFEQTAANLPVATPDQTHDLGASTEEPVNRVQRPSAKRRGSSFGTKSAAYRPRAPNMSLNISPDQKRADLELQCAAILGIFCQCAVLVVAALLSYYPPWSNGKFLGASKRSKAYAFPLTAAGSLAVFFGLFLCTSVVESASMEKKWGYKRPLPSNSDDSVASDMESSSSKTSAKLKTTGIDQSEPEFDIRCMWVQGHGTINDQTFDSWVVAGRELRASIYTSERCKELQDPDDQVPEVAPLNGSPIDQKVQKTYSWNSTDSPRYQNIKTSLLKAFGVDPRMKLEAYAVFGCGISLVGFIVQFIGLRGSHYFVAVLNLVATMIMTIVRAYLRRGLSKHPLSERLTQQYELDWFATNFVTSRELIWDLWANKISESSPLSTMITKAHDAFGNTGHRVGISPRADIPRNAKWGASHIARRHSIPKQPKRHQPLLQIKLVFLPLRTLDPWKTKSTPCTEESAQRVVEVRKRLQELTSKWDGPATKYAVAVARAIQLTMGMLKLRKTAVDDSTEKHFRWQIPVEWNGKDDHIELSIRHIRSENKWKIERSLIEAILSLWMFAFEETHLSEGELFDPESNDPTEKGDWYQKNTHVRVLATYSKSTDMQLQWWVERELREGLKNLVSGQIFELPRPKSGFMPGLDTRKSRIVGFDDSGFRGPGQTPPSIRPSGAVGQRYLIAPSSMPTVQLLAQHIYSSFIWAISEYLEPIEADIFRPPLGEDLPPKPKVTSGILKDLIETITRTTDLGTAEDIYICIIPALSKKNILSDADCVVHHANSLAEFNYGSPAKWEKAAKIYKSLFNDALKFGPQSKIGIKATLALVEFFSFLIIKEKQTAPDDDQTKIITKLKKDIAHELRSADKSVIVELLQITEKLKLKHVQLELSIVEEKTATQRTKEVGPVQTRFGRNLLHAAARENTLDQMVMKDIPELDKLINAKDHLERTPLHYHILFGSTDGSTGHRQPATSKTAKMRSRDTAESTLAQLLDAGANLNEIDHIKATPIHYAVTSFDREEPLRILLLKALDMKEAKDRYGRTALHHAAERGSPLATGLLVRLGADITSRNLFGMLPLHSAAVYNREKEVLNQLKVDHQIHATDTLGRSPLVLALLSSQFNAAHHLLHESGRANHSAWDPKKWSPLHHAAALSGQPEFAQQVAEYYRKDKDGQTTLGLSARDIDGRLPGHIAVIHRHPQLIEHLFDKDTVRIQDTQGSSALHLAVINDNIEAIPILISLEYKWHNKTEEGASKDLDGTSTSVEPLPLLKSKDKHGRLAVDLAAELGKIDALNQLLDPNLDSQSTASPNGTHPRDHGGLGLGSLPCCQEDTSLGSTPLHYAASTGQVLAIRLLRERGADVEARDKEGRTPLFRAAYEENAPSINVLLDPTLGTPANPNTMDKNGTPALLISVGYSTSIAAATELLSAESIDPDATNSSNLTLMHLAARDGRHELVDLLLERRVNVNIMDSQDRTAIDLATDPIIIEKLLTYSRQLNPDAEEYFAQQLLAAVANAQDDQLDKIKSLLKDNMAAPTATTDRGENVLHLAVKKGRIDIVDILLSADHIKYFPGFLDKTTETDCTALHLACELQDVSILEYLLKLNTSPSQKTELGDTALHVAVKAGNDNIVRTLLATEREGWDWVSSSALIEEANNEGHTALWIAISDHDETIARILLDHGANPATVNRNGLTIWHKQAKRGDTNVLEFLSDLPDYARQRVLEAGANEYHGTPLQSAILAGEKQFVRRFIGEGASFDQTDLHGWSPRHCFYLTDDDNIRGQIESAAFAEYNLKDMPNFESKEMLIGPTEWSDTYKPEFIILATTVHPRPVMHAFRHEVFSTADSTRGWLSDEKRFGVQADHPFKPFGRRYFEVHITEKAHEEIIGIGVCNGLEELEGMVGWRTSSWGYHGDDGNLFHGSGWGIQHPGYGPFTVNDTVGCGLDKRSRLFFTKNGKKLGTPFPRVLGQMFPCVRLATGGRLRAEFGENCKYQLQPEDESTLEDLRIAVNEGWKEYRQRQEEAARNRLDSEDGSTSNDSNDSTDHLQVAETEGRASGSMRPGSYSTNRRRSNVAWAAGLEDPNP